MEKITSLIQVQGSMMLYFALGYICRSTGIINDVSEKNLSKAITDIVFPCLIFYAMVDSFSAIDWSTVDVVLIISILLFAISYVLGRFVFFRNSLEDRKPILVFGTMISNAAFIGLPLVSGLFGSLGIFYTTIYMTVSRVFLWTIGVALFPNGSSKHPMLNVLTNPNSIAMFVAIIYWILPFQLPDFIMDAVYEIGSMSTVFCMVMVGSLLKGIQWREIFDHDIVYYSIIRLIVLPLVLFAVLKLLRIEYAIIAVMTLIVSTPAPTLGSVLASRYGSDKRFASCLVLASTVFSLVTIPLLALLYC